MRQTPTRRSDLRERLRLWAAYVFYYVGLVRVALWWKRRRGCYVIILNYHRAAGGHLRDHMEGLRHHYRITDLDSALRELYASTDAVDDHRNDPRPPLVLTFDDGYLDNYTHALLHAREVEVPIVVFPLPGYVDAGTCFWWLAPEYLRRHTREESVVLNGSEYSLAQPDESDAFVDTLKTRLLEAESVVVREELLAGISQALDVSLPRRTGDPQDAGDLPASWVELLEMKSSGWVTFGAHTMHHPVLAYLADETEAEREVASPRRILEQRLGQRISAFAYPIGSMSDIGERAVAAVKEAGYSWGLTGVEGVNTPETDPYLLRRLPGDIRVHWLVLEAELAGLLGIVSRIRASKARWHERVRSIRTWRR